MGWILKFASNFRHFNMLRDAWVSAAQFWGFPSGTIFPFRCRLAKFLGPKYPVGCYLQSPSGTWHFLSADPIDEVVLREMLGQDAHFYFPDLPKSVVHDLNKGGMILDIGAFNGSWTAEMLIRYPGSQALLLEPNLDKCKNISRTLKAGGIQSRARIVPAALASTEGRRWLMRSDDGSWGDWIQSDSPGESNGARQVSTTTLARALDGAQPVIVKCNAEGGEVEFIEQLLSLGLHPKLMILFIHPQHINPTSLWFDLSNAGYVPKVVDDRPTHPCWYVD
jgi:FkbM family methyltransferase